MNINALQTALNRAVAAAQTYIAKNPDGPNWYPCGFVWLTYKCRKNAKESAILIKNGWRWDDYEKRYTLSMGRFHNTQSMDYKAGIARAMLDSLKQDGMVGFSYRENID